MKFVAVNEVPGKVYKVDLRARLEEFMAMNIKIAKVDFNEKEYKDSTRAHWSFSQAIKRCALPITATCRKGELYLIRNDM